MFVRRRWAHPRVGGENIEAAAMRAHEAGSSPRGRGKLCNRLDAIQTFWLIPAWAGKTPFRLRSRAAAAAHPRVGGENGSVGELLP